MHRTIRTILLAALAASCPALAADAPPQDAEARRFQSPEDAAKALLQAAQSGDPAQIAGLFGARHAGLLSSGDEVDDKNNREAFAAMAQEKLAVEKTGDDLATVHAGPNGWPFPIPLARRGDGWQFDAERGREEILNRRIGRNELGALGVIAAYVEAQFDYAGEDRDGDGVAEYAQKLASEPGKFDGLFWEAGPDQPESPLGPLVAEARAGGHELKGGGQPVPYHGYYYRILTRQGPGAPGGAYDYLINGNLIAGFGLVAFPADYGNSGVMSFIVNHQGRIYQKDLGPKTAEAAKALKAFDPGAGWRPVDGGG